MQTPFTWCLSGWPYEVQPYQHRRPAEMVHCWTSARSRNVRNTANNGHCARWAEANALSLLNPALRTDRLPSRPNRIVAQTAPDFASSPLGLTDARPNRQVRNAFKVLCQSNTAQSKCQLVSLMEVGTSVFQYAQKLHRQLLFELIG